MFNGFIIVLGLIILGKSGFDFYHALTVDQTVGDVADQNVSSQSLWYFVGVAYGGICYYALTDSMPKLIGGLIGGACLLMSAFVAFDTLDEGYIEPGQRIADCYKISNSAERSECIAEFTENELE